MAEQQMQAETGNAGPTETSKKRFFIKKGTFQAELNNFLTRELAEDGYSGVEVRPLKKKTEVIIRATRTQSVVGEKGRRIRELTSLVQQRFGFKEGALEMFAEKVEHRGLCAVAQCESLRYKLVGGLAVRRAAYGVVRFIMESGAKGCEVVVSGKIRGQRAKAMKFSDGLMIHSGQPTEHYIQTAVRHVLLRQGVLGLKVKIMLPHDREGKRGPKQYLPDQVIVSEPKDEEKIPAPYSKDKDAQQKKIAMEFEALQQQQVHAQQQQQPGGVVHQQPLPPMHSAPQQPPHMPPPAQQQYQHPVADPSQPPPVYMHQQAPPQQQPYEVPMPNNPYQSPPQQHYQPRGPPY